MPTTCSVQYDHLYVCMYVTHNQVICFRNILQITRSRELTTSITLENYVLHFVHFLVFIIVSIIVIFAQTVCRLACLDIYYPDVPIFIILMYRYLLS